MFDARPIVLNLPLPPAINAARRIDWRVRERYAAWLKRADATVLARSPGHRLPKPIEGPYEAIITVTEGRHDLDAHCKSLIDFCTRLKLVAGDGPAHLRRVVLEFGDAPEGARVELRPVEGAHG